MFQVIEAEIEREAQKNSQKFITLSYSLKGCMYNIHLLSNLWFSMEKTDHADQTEQEWIGRI